MIERTIEDIAEAVAPHGAAPRRCSVLLGAGCSISAGIPSASDIVRQIKVNFPAAYARAASCDYPDCMAALERGVRRDLIGAYIDEAHKGRVWIVVGYSGENDPVFDLLARVKTFEYGLFEYGLYWIGYGAKPSKHVADKLLGRECGAHFIGGWDADDFFCNSGSKT